MTSTDQRLAPLDVNWEAVEEEASDWLRRYIAIDTTNPPGGEEAGAQLLAEFMRKEGIEPTFYDAGNDRISISARLPGTNSAGTKPLVLLSHIDVVPAEAEYWQEAPFSAALKDGVIWGRGALDMKGLGIMELLVFALLKRHKIQHQRDILYLAVADEEEGSRFGMSWLEEHQPELLRADAVINEGSFGFGDLLGKRGLIFGVGPSEKAPLWLRLRTKGRPGHGSIPHRKNAAVWLTRALGRICDAKQPAQLRPEMEVTVATLKEAGVLPADLDFKNPAVLAQAAESNDLFRALLSNTVTLTTLNAGRKHNVIPAHCEATLDCRLLPGEDVDAFLQDLRGIIDDDNVEIETVYRFDPLVSSMRNELVEHIEATIRHEVDGGVVLPMVSPGFTDSRIYRKHGVPCVGFTPVLLATDELGGVHGHDERISTENLKLGTRLLLDTVRRAAGV